MLLRISRYCLKIVLFVVLVLVLASIVSSSAQENVVKVVTPRGTKNLPKTRYVETSTLYTARFGMAGIVDSIVDPTVVHVSGIGYVKLADITVPKDKEIEALNFLRENIINKLVYLDIDDLNVFTPEGYILAVVYLQENPNTTTLINLNMLLVVKGYALILDTANEFKPATWKLTVSLIQATTTQEVRETQTTTPTAFINNTVPANTTKATTTVTTTATTTTTAIIKVTGNTTTPLNNTSSLLLPQPQPAMVISSVPPPQPPPTPIVRETTKRTRPTRTTMQRTTITSAESIITVLKTMTKTVTITRVSYITITGENITPFYATTPGIIMLSALSALLGSLATIILLRKYIS